MNEIRNIYIQKLLNKVERLVGKKLTSVNSDIGAAEITLFFNREFGLKFRSTPDGMQLTLFKV